MPEEPLMRLNLPVEELPTVAQLFYQPIRGKTTTASVEQLALRRKVFTAAIDGDAMALAVALRDLKRHGIGATDQVCEWCSRAAQWE